MQCRYIHIKDPLRYGRWMTKRVIYCSIATIWLLAALISFMPVSMDLHKPQRLEQQLNEPVVPIGNSNSNSSSGEGTDSPRTQPLPSYPQCALDLTPTYAIVSSCISFYFPCIVMLVRVICQFQCFAFDCLFVCCIYNRPYILVSFEFIIAILLHLNWLPFSWVYQSITYLLCCIFCFYSSWVSIWYI